MLLILPPDALCVVVLLAPLRVEFVSSLMFCVLSYVSRVLSAS